MTPDELAALTRAWRGLPWETRDLFARWLAGRLAVQSALLDLEGDAPDDGLARRVRLLRRDRRISQAELGARAARHLAEVTHDRIPDSP